MQAKYILHVLYIIFDSKHSGDNQSSLFLFNVNVTNKNELTDFLDKTNQCHASTWR